MITDEKKVAIATRLASLPEDKQRLLSQRLADEGIDIWQLPIVPIPGSNVPDAGQAREGEANQQAGLSPLSFAQQRLWFIDQLNQNQSAEYNLFFGLQFEGELRVDWVEAALNHILSRHAVLRMQIVDVDGVGYQKPRPYAPMTVSVTDLSHIDTLNNAKAGTFQAVKESKPHDEEAIKQAQELSDKHAAALRELAQQQTDTPFDLTQDRLFRFELIKLHDQHHVGMFTVHHIVFDAWSVDNLVREFSQAYHALASGHDVALPALSIQYQDFAHWQRRWADSEHYQAQVAYWQEQLLGAPEQIRLAIEKPASQARAEHISGSTNSVDSASLMDLENQGKERGRVFPQALSARIYELAQTQNTTLYVTLLAAFNLLLQRYSGEQDICVGTSIANRPRLETEALLGYFVNTLVMRNHIDPAQPFSAFLQQVSQTATQAYQHQDLPFDHLLELLQVERKNARSPLFQILFVMNNAAGNARLSLPGVTLSSYEKPLDKARFDLTLRVTEMKAEGQIRCDIEFNTQLFDEARIEALLEHYQTLLAQICEAPQQALSSYGLLTASQSQALLVPPQSKADALADSLSSFAESPQHGQTLHQLFEYWASKQPEALALTCDGESFTYKALNAKANVLAHYLRERGVSHESHVALMLSRSASLIIGILAVLKAGGCYVPMDVKWPQSRLDQLLEDCSAALILSDSQLHAAEPQPQDQSKPQDQQRQQTQQSSCAIPLILLDSIDQELAEYRADNPDFGVQLHEAAYAIYTSGSTGVPKGVVIEHRQIVAYAQGVMARIADEHQSAFQFASVSTVAADLGNTAIFGALCFGGALHLVSDDKAFDAEQVALYMAAHQVEVLKIVPTHLRGLMQALKPDTALLQKLLPSKVLILGGEACALDLVQEVRALCPSLRVINHYGPTETTVGALTYELPLEASQVQQVFESIHAQAGTQGVAALPIGQALPQYQALVLDEGCNIVPPGLSGELYIGGAGVARGYHARAELNQARFVEVTLPFAPFDQPMRMYRTGDKATLLPNQHIQFQGRFDDQVKIRGHRVELGEIEACLNAFEGVNQAFVAYIESQLFAWVAVEDAAQTQGITHSTQDNTQLTQGIAHLTQKLSQALPDYMQPSTLFTVDALPVNVNGKLDRKALKQQALEFIADKKVQQGEQKGHQAGWQDDQQQALQTEEQGNEAASIAPRSDIERTIADVWQQVLKQENISIHDSFFHLGGDSILSLQVIARLKKAGLKLLPKQLFNHPTIAELSELVKVLPHFEGESNDNTFNDSNLNLNSDKADNGEVSEEGPLGEPSIQAAPVDAVIPLSFSQQRLWFLDQLQGPNSIYNMPMAVALTGELNEQTLAQSFAALVARHGVLRTHFIAENGQPRQVLGNGDGFAVQWEDLTELDTQAPAQHAQEDVHEAAQENVALAQSEQEQQAHARVLAFARHAFEIDKPGLFRVKVLKLASQKHWLLVNCHHMIADGWSLGVLVQEFCTLYHSIESGKGAEVLPALPIHYADYAYWQHETGREAYQAQLDYWAQQLASAPALLAMPTDRPRPQKPSYRGQHIPLSIAPDISEKLKYLAQSQGTTLYTVLLAAWQVLLHRYSGQNDICVGSPIANRHLPETQGVVGFFANTTVLRGDLSGDPRFIDLVQQLKQVSLEAQANQDVPFEQLVDHLNVPRETAYAPLFQVMFAWGVTQSEVQHSIATAQGELALSNVPNSAKLLGTGTAKFDMELSLRERPVTSDVQGIEGRLEFASDLFDAQSMTRLWQHFTQLLSAIIQAPEQPIDQIPLVLSEEQALFEQWNQTAHDFSEFASFDDLFKAQVQQSGSQIAARFDTSNLTGELENAQWSYQSLDAQAEKIAQYLLAQGIAPDDRVIVYQRRGLPMLASLIGVMRAGAAYVPVDPNYPADRVAFMIKDAGAKCILLDEHVSLNAQTSQDAVLSEGDVFNDIPCVNVDTLLALPLASHQGPDSNAAAQVNQATGDNLAYLIYTSGSTGKPKAVQVTRANMVNFLCAMKTTFTPNNRDALLAVTSLSFDIAVLELFLPLISGAQVVIASETLALDGAGLQHALQANNITMMQATPVSWKMLLASGGLQAGPQASRLTVMCGGEAFPIDLAKQLVQLPHLSVWNMYGPTETTVWSTVCCLSEVDGYVPIGQPIANTTIHILDSNLQPVPLGVAGELCIGGDGVTRGYLGRDALTEERYVRTDFGRLYRTGDLARYRLQQRAETQSNDEASRGKNTHDKTCDNKTNNQASNEKARNGVMPHGVIECLGRLDQQVKVRGYRIELGEVESALKQHEQVQDAVVSVQQQQGESVLVAHVVLANRDAEEQINEPLRTLLKAALPDYMVPNGFMYLDALPLTPNGKVDRNALPPVSFESSRNEYIAPRNDTETQLCAIWQSLLGLERIGVEDNFFELGGHSLLAARMRAEIEAQLERDISLMQMFSHQTVASLAALIDSTQTQFEQDDVDWMESLMDSMEEL